MFHYRHVKGHILPRIKILISVKISTYVCIMQYNDNPEITGFMKILKIYIKRELPAVPVLCFHFLVVKNVLIDVSAHAQ